MSKSVNSYGRKTQPTRQLKNVILYARELSIAMGRTYDKTDRKLYKDLRTKIGTAIDNAAIGHPNVSRILQSIF